jgi:hypothetical protein
MAEDSCRFIFSEHAGDNREGHCDSEATNAESIGERHPIQIESVAFWRKSARHCPRQELKSLEESSSIISGIPGENLVHFDFYILYLKCNAVLN